MVSDRDGPDRGRGDRRSGPDPAGDLTTLMTEAGPLARRFAEAGYRVYLVGGVVRDLLLGRPVGGDIDLTTDAPPQRTQALLEGWADAVWAQGARFGTIGCQLGSRTYEITTHRAEVYVHDSRKPVVAFSTEVTEDLARRDFTVNAMARQVPAGNLVVPPDDLVGRPGALIDPHGGRADLAAGRLRTPLDPHVTLSEDPLRMVRAARFAASHDLEPDPSLVLAMTDMAARLRIVAIERIRAELDRLLVTHQPSRGLDLLARTGLLAHVLPEHARLTEPDWDDLLARVDRTPAQLVARVVVLHDGIVDLGTGMARLRFSNEQIAAASAVQRALDVVRAGTRSAGGTPAAGRLPTATGMPAAAGTAAAGGTPAAGAAPTARTEASLSVSDVIARRVAAAAGGHLVSTRAAAVGLLAPAVATGLAAALDRLSAAGELDDLGPQFDGRTVMAVLGLGPGPQVGEALAFLRELRLVEGRLSRADVESRLRAWWSTEADGARDARHAGDGGVGTGRTDQPPTSW